VLLGNEFRPNQAVPRPVSKRPKVDPWLKSVGENLRQARKNAGLTQEQVAERADLAPRTIQKIESGRITILITTLRRLRAVVGGTYDALLRDRS
jgi:DNA-binding XRE family transcriptional regulator